MQNFVFNATTEMNFGRGQIEKLPKILGRYGKNVLMVYGMGSIKRNGIYDKVMSLLDDFNVYELDGVTPNPRIDKVREGVMICRNYHIDVVLAVGGGSTIDCSKAIAGAYYYDGDAWDIVMDNSRITDVLPIVVVLTAAATGSEMNKNAVISNPERHEKIGTSSLKFIPRAAICDPEYTYGVSKFQTAAGTADIMSHVFENYFKSEKGTYIQDRFGEGIIEACLKYCPRAMEDPCDYDARANLMWASSMALNGLVGCGKGSQSWSCHPIEHELSAFYDITHGAGLAIVTPKWMRHILNEKTARKFKKYTRNVFHVQDTGDDYEMAEIGIDKTEQFFKDIGLPSTLSELGIDDSKIPVMAHNAVIHGRLDNAYVPLDDMDVEKILRACL
ncbi:MAG: iron-containing alcohol dehydrogenase [Clostridia bacterium]|nr:iron-containing alcohol dehydrogenase [[Bacteroides] pectinophilus]MDD5873476.1 iron-containing alcohol dehydrogenase [Clostridia bacterium]